jgi:hypothetical protein
MKDQKFTQKVSEFHGDCSCKGSGYCLFKELIETMHPSTRMITQFACIEIYKWIESEKRGIDIGRQTAAQEWVDRGYAKKFAEVYDENLSVKEIYRKTVSES